MSHIHGLPPLPHCFDGFVTVHRAVSETSQGEVQEGTSHCLVFTNAEKDNDSSTHKSKSPLPEDKGSEHRGINNNAAISPNFSETPHARINTALHHLKSEMVMPFVKYCQKIISSIVPN